MNSKDMATIKKISYNKVVRPMKTAFTTARGSKMCATSIIVTVTCDDGSVGTGEVPTSFVVPQETPEVIKRSIRRAAKSLCGRDVSKWASLTAMLRRIFPDFHMTCSGLETAMFRAHLASTGSDEHTWWGRNLDAIETDITIPFARNLETITGWLDNALKSGFDVYKIKISGDVVQDVKFVRSVTEILSDSAISYTIRLDGNQGFTCDSALRLLDRLDTSIELFEQPLKFDDYEGMKQLTAKAPVPIIADETVFCVQDCQRVIDDELAHGINIKIAKSGISQSRQIIRLAKQAKHKLMIGCMTETMVGLSAAIYCAMGTNAFDYIDLDSVHFLHHRKQYQDIMINGPMYHLGGQP